MNHNARAINYDGRLFLKTYKWHIFAWLFFAVYESTSVAVVTGHFADPKGYLFHYPVNILLFYIHAMVTLPAGYQTGKPNFMLLLFTTSGLLISYIVISYYVDYFFLPSKESGQIRNFDFSHGFVLSTLWRGIYFMSFATTYFYVRLFIDQRQITDDLEKEAIRSNLSEKELEVELADSKNAYLIAQINPHFLFNTLTFIYDRIMNSSPEAGKAVLNLSKMMRYAIESDHGPEKITLLPEIKQVENLIELCRIRKSEQYIHFDYQEETAQLKIIPLVLLSLAENMVKHGNLSDPDNPAQISVRLISGYLQISTDNLQNTGINDTGFHTGLDNIKKRLKHTYGNDATFRSGTKYGNRFSVVITLPIEI